MAILLYNLRTLRGALPPGVVRCDRRTPWGNPHRIRPGHDRASVIAAYRADLERSPERVAEMRRRLAHATGLACWCVPEACHTEVIRDVLEHRGGFA